MSPVNPLLHRPMRSRLAIFAIFDREQRGRTTPMTARVNVDMVTSLLRQVAADVVMPRFRDLRYHDIDPKPGPDDPDDVVTIVDHETERRLTTELAGIDPGAAMLGEEAVYDDPSLLGLVESSERLWILDPIDGTKNFVRGLDGFGIMVAWAVRGVVEAAWVVLPAKNEAFVAERGSGAYLNGKRLSIPPQEDPDVPRGAVHLRFMPREIAAGVSRATRGRFSALSDVGCSAAAYSEIAQGERDFEIYYRLYPWDHAPGALVLTEAGGSVQHVNGETYTPRSSSQVTIVANSDRMAEQVRKWIRGDLD
jgi:fructose-1,6-bisphosphatase/inositol monophosphatase family enzyme